MQENIGRPASIFDTKIYYFGLISAMDHTTRSSKELLYAIQTKRHTRAFIVWLAVSDFRQEPYEITLTFPFMKLNIVYIFRKSYRETDNFLL